MARESYQPWHEVRSRGGMVLQASPRLLRPARFKPREDLLMECFRTRRDPALFEDLYVQTRPLLLDWVRWLGRHSAGAWDAEEVLQDVYVNIFRYADSFDAARSGGFRSWSRTIAANVFKRSLWGKKGSQKRLVSLPDSGGQEFSDPGPSPSVRLEGGESSSALARAWPVFLAAYAKSFAELSSRDQMALELVEVRQASYAEAARELEVGTSNFKMIVLRARRRLLLRMQKLLGRVEPAVA